MLARFAAVPLAHPLLATPPQCVSLARPLAPALPALQPRRLVASQLPSLSPAQPTKDDDFDLGSMLDSEGPPVSGGMYPEMLARSAVDPYQGIAAAPFPAEVRAVLERPIEPTDVEIRPDGLLYLPEIKYRRILNAAFGSGGWAMMARPGTAIDHNSAFSREYALYALGRYVASARGEQIYADKLKMTYGMVEEGAKSNALMRCCKDLGVASELWDPLFISQWKAKYATEFWAENSSTGAKKRFWRASNRPAMLAWPWREAGSTNAPSAAAPASAPAQAGTPTPAPAPAASAPTPLARQHSAPTSRSEKAAADSGATGFTMTDIVPAQMKKYAGKTFLEIGGDAAGRAYLKWAASSDARLPAAVKAACDESLQYWKAREEDKDGDSEEFTV